jgi:hypothetical protein
LLRFTARLVDWGWLFPLAPEIFKTLPFADAAQTVFIVPTHGGVAVRKPCFPRQMIRSGIEPEQMVAWP